MDNYKKQLSQHVTDDLFQDMQQPGGAYQRVLHGHEINECNEAIVIIASPEDSNNGGASHNYLLCYPDPSYGEDPKVWEVQPVNFQNGPIKEVGTNGVTQEALLTIIADRLTAFQAGPYACVENEEALDNIKAALGWLHVRTQKRESRGVEGTHKV